MAWWEIKVDKLEALKGVCVSCGGETDRPYCVGDGKSVCEGCNNEILVMGSQFIPQEFKSPLDTFKFGGPRGSRWINGVKTGRDAFASHETAGVSVETLVNTGG